MPVRMYYIRGILVGKAHVNGELEFSSSLALDVYTIEYSNSESGRVHVGNQWRYSHSMKNPWKEWRKARKKV